MSNINEKVAEAEDYVIRFIIAVLFFPILLLSATAGALS